MWVLRVCPGNTTPPPASFSGWPLPRRSCPRWTWSWSTSSWTTTCRGPPPRPRHRTSFRTTDSLQAEQIKLVFDNFDSMVKIVTKYTAMAIYLKYLLKAPRSNITRWALYKQLMDEGLCCPPSRVSCVGCVPELELLSLATGVWRLKPTSASSPFPVVTL